MPKLLPYALASLSIISFLPVGFSQKLERNLRHTGAGDQIHRQHPQLDHDAFHQTTQSQNLYTDDAQKDEVISLPGLTFEPNFKHFSGYIPVSESRKIHYWYIESSNDPSNDPVIFWTNGGPGCSGLLGLGTEFGPFIFEKDGVLSSNPHTWNQVANILYVEQPAGVGFSYFTKDSDAYVGDDRAAVDNYVLLVEFFQRFPERKSNEFYIASESYGGHYIPHLAREILDRNLDGAINFRGFLIGNPYVDPFSNDATMIQTAYMHGLIANPLFLSWQKQCTDPNDYDDESCSKLVDAMFEAEGDGINPYALDFPACTEADNGDGPSTVESSNGNFLLDVNTIATTPIVAKRKLASQLVSKQSQKLIKHRSARNVPFLPTEDVYHPCADNHLNYYLNRADVKEALHVEMNKDWSECTDDIIYSQKDSDTPQMALYEDLIKRAKKRGSNLKIMIFSGDDDSVCSTASTQYWIYDVGTSPKEGKLWNAWKFENQTAGYITEFDLGDDSDSIFLFLTVHGAGHEVPAYRPAEALAMLKSYFSGNWNI